MSIILKFAYFYCCSENMEEVSLHTEHTYFNKLCYKVDQIEKKTRNNLFLSEGRQGNAMTKR